MPRLGGWIFSFEEMRAWAARIKNKAVEDIDKDAEDDNDFSEAYLTVLRRVRKSGGDVICVTYPTSVCVMMVVTQCADHSRWRRGDDPTKLKQFKMGRKEEVVHDMLEKEGQCTHTTLQLTMAINTTSEGVQGLQFVTSHGDF